MLCAGLSACRGGTARGLATSGDGAGALDGDPAPCNGGELVVGVGAGAHGQGGHCGNVVDCLDLYLVGCGRASRMCTAWTTRLPMIGLGRWE